MRNIAIILLVVIWPLTLAGQNIKNFSTQNIVNNTYYSLSEHGHEKAVVLIFFSGKCAYSEYYLERIKALNNEFASQGISFALINSNNSDFVPEESETEMKKFAIQQNLSLPYLSDKNKEIKLLFGATRTPEVFVLKPGQNQFNVVYKGAIDDNPQTASDVNHAYLKDNLRNLLNNSAIELNQTRPVGCLIK